jgi:hypothetical protein
MVVSIRSAMVSRFCVRPTYKRWFLKIDQVTMKHDPFDANVGIHVDFYIYDLAFAYSIGSLKCSVKRTCTSSALSTNESA